MGRQNWLLLKILLAAAMVPCNSEGNSDGNDDKRWVEAIDANTNIIAEE
jgi:hypothetical protein